RLSFRCISFRGIVFRPAGVSSCGNTPATTTSAARCAMRHNQQHARGYARMVTMTTAEATVATLIAHGIDTMYALPGVHNDPLFDALFKASDRIRTVHTRHEQGAA